MVNNKIPMFIYQINIFICDFHHLKHLQRVSASDLIRRGVKWLTESWVFAPGHTPRRREEN
ncbi:protein of unknown function [Serratia sp. Tan611]|nr:protein of unknown function [Serratia sp. Tan611]